MLIKTKTKIVSRKQTVYLIYDSCGGAFVFNFLLPYCINLPNFQKLKPLCINPGGFFFLTLYPLFCIIFCFILSKMCSVYQFNCFQCNIFIAVMDMERAFTVKFKLLICRQEVTTLNQRWSNRCYI